MTNVGGGADPDLTKNAFTVTINDDVTDSVPDLSPLEAIAEQCELSKSKLDGMFPTATDNQMGIVTVTNNITSFPDHGYDYDYMGLHRCSRQYRHADKRGDLPAECSR